MHLIETPDSPRIWQQVKQLAGRISVPYDLAWPVLKDRPNTIIYGERINDLSPLPPESHFRKAMLKAAQRFVDDLGKKRERYELTTNQADLLIYGPFQHREASLAPIGFQQDEMLFPDTLDFQIVGDFKAQYGFLVPDVTPEETKHVQAVSVAQWRQAEAAAQAKLRSQ